MCLLLISFRFTYNPKRRQGFYDKVTEAFKQISKSQIAIICRQFCWPDVDKWRKSDVILLIGQTYLPTVG